MKWDELLQVVGKEPVFHSSLLLAGSVDPVDMGRQLSRWVRSGKLIQFRRGLYALSKQHQKTSPHRFLIANRLKRASYVSMQSALEHYGLIPEYVPSVSSVTTGRPETVSTPVGSFIFRHIRTELFREYRTIVIDDRQSVFMAAPEKALLDLLYLTPGSDNLNYLRGLRLQNITKINLEFLAELAKSTGSQKLQRAAHKLHALMPELDES